jgi:methionyl-tRNA formyltransferase
VALDLGLPVTDRVDDLLTLEPRPDLGVVVAFGRLIKPHVFGAIPMINLHFSRLPRWRGAAPVEWAILDGDNETAACVMAIAEALDEGDVYRCDPVHIDADVSATELRDRLAAVGTNALLDVVGRWPIDGVAQQGESTYARKLTRDDLHLDWSRAAIDVHRVVRVGGAWTTYKGGELKVWRTALPPRGVGIVVPAGDGTIEVLEVQPAGKARMAAKDWANGVRWQAGDSLGT